jgi:chromosome segregation protein
VVTLDGDLVRPGGSVAGGSEDDRRGGGVLARERERRALPQEVAAAAQAMKEVEQQIGRGREAQAQAQADLATRERAAQEAGERRSALQRQLQDRQRELDRARQAVDWRRSLAAESERQAGAMAAEMVRLETALADLEATHAARLGELAEVEANLQRSADDDAAARATEARATAATAQAERRSQEMLLQRARESAQQAAGELSARQRRMAELAAERQQLAQEVAESAREADALQAQIDALAARIAPAEAEVDQLAAQQVAEEGHEAILRQQARQQDAVLQQAKLAYERARDDLERLRREIDRDLGFVVLEAGAGQAEQPPLPLPALAD